MSDTTAEDRRAAIRARLDAAAKVHRPVEGFSRMLRATYLYCWECSEDGGDGSRGHIKWPYETARALRLGDGGNR